MKKKVINIFVVITLVFTLMGQAISFAVYGVEIGKFNSKDAVIPETVVESKGMYYALLEDYGGLKPYKIAVGKNMKKLKTVYKSNKKKYVWFMDAEDGIAAWTEAGKGSAQKVKSYYKKKVRTIYSTKKNDCICQNLGVYKKSVYFTVQDTKNKEAYIAEYNTKDGKLKPIEETKIKYTQNGENSINCFSINKGVLVYSYSQNGKCIIKSMDIDSNDDCNYQARSIILDSNIAYIYAVSIDNKTLNIAVYYMADDYMDKLGYIDKNSDKIKFLIDFDGYAYAYQDQITCCDGLLLYIEQQNVSGNINDHYSLQGYDFTTGKQIPKIRATYAVTAKDSILLTQWVNGIKKCKIHRKTIDELK